MLGFLRNGHSGKRVLEIYRWICKPENAIILSCPVSTLCHIKLPKVPQEIPRLTNSFRRMSSYYEIVDHNEEVTDKQLGESTLMLQEGTDIQEVPVAVIRDSPNKRNNEGPKPFVKLKAEEETAFVEGFKKFHSPQEVLSILHTIPSQEVTPVVALSILRRLFEVENNFVFKNNGESWVIATENSPKDTFARMAIVNRLVDILILGDDTSVLLDALDMLRSDRKTIVANVIRFSEDPEDDENLATGTNTKSNVLEFSRYRSKLCEHVLIRTTKGQLSLEQVCRAICTMGKISQLFPAEIEADFIDKMWVGISEKSDDIGQGNILEVFRTVQYFKKSQRLVMRIAERKFLNILWKMDTATIAEICDLLLMKESHNGQAAQQYWGIPSTRLLTSLSKIIHMNLHQLTEEELVKITEAFNALDFCDNIFEKTLSKYMKAKCLKLSNPATLVAIMDYVKKYRIRSSNILEGVVEYLVLHHGRDSPRSRHNLSLSPAQVASILVPFGYLDHQPKQGQKFWEIVERLLSVNFFDLPPKDVIDALLACVYLQKYPLNFVNRIYSPYFLDRLHTTETDINVLQQARSNLKLLDIALTIECGAKYPGPFLPRDFTAKSIFVDGRITRMRTFLQESLTAIFSTSSHKIETSVVLPNLPLHPVYIVDILVSPKTDGGTPGSGSSMDLDTKILPPQGAGSDHESSDKTVSDGGPELHPHVALRNRYNLRYQNSDHYIPIKQSSDYNAILIHIPEHFASDGKNLLGPQVMRIRHLKLLGFTVVNLTYETLINLRSTPRALMDYIKSQIKDN